MQISIELPDDIANQFKNANISRKDRGFAVTGILGILDRAAMMKWIG